MPYRQVQNWILAFLVLLSVIVFGMWVAARKLKADLADIADAQRVRAEYSDTLIRVFRTVDSTLAVSDSISVARLDSLEKRLSVKDRKRENQIRQVNAAVEAQARAIQHTR